MGRKQGVKMYKIGSADRYDLYNDHKILEYSGEKMKFKISNVAFMDIK